MKKLIMSVVAIATLSTSGFANSNESHFKTDKKETCEKVFKNETILKNINAGTGIKLSSNHVAIQAFSEGYADHVKMRLGDLSIDFLKNIGVGTNTKLTWDNIILRYYTFNDYLKSKNSQIELLTFFNSIYNENLMYKDMSREYSDKINTYIFYKDYASLEFQTFESYVISFSDDKNFKEFFKLIALDNHDETYNFIKTVNENTGTKKYLKEFQDKCKDNNKKTVADLIFPPKK